ncbi:uncharacterized protein LOC143882480 [Tasmannia lanceolata]|uniref:uncharacterized protein LOC143882480 n=1 Tax=Tasmannia lanceolata TaxID=3420 RepID=UPI004063617D
MARQRRIRYLRMKRLNIASTSEAISTRVSTDLASSIDINIRPFPQHIIPPIRLRSYPDDIPAQRTHDIDHFMGFNFFPSNDIHIESSERDSLPQETLRIGIRQNFHQGSTSNTAQRKFREYNGFTETWDFGPPNTGCQFCGALMWNQERSSKPGPVPRFFMCCQDSKIQLPLLGEAPNYLQDLHRGIYDNNRTCFRELIRAYNSMYSFTSIGGMIDHSIVDGRSPYSFRISGSNYHKIGSLLPNPNCKPMFAQLYVCVTGDEAKNRMDAVHINNGRFTINEDVVAGLRQMLDTTNPYVQTFRYVRDFLANSVRTEQRSRDARQYNLPTASEVAALMVGDGSEIVERRDIILCTNDGFLQRINECHPAYMPLQYPLLFPYGEDGWRINIPIRSNPNSTSRKREFVSMREFYAYRIQYRPLEGKTLMRSGRLFQQFVVDAYAAIEEQRLYWVRTNQKQLRANVYEGLQDAVRSGDHNAASIGQRLVLPSSFTGGPRYMAQAFQDAMAICQWYGPPDLFITFTCNAKWEINSALQLIPGQRVEDRPDIVARVFNIKKKQLINDLRSEKIFGSVVAGASYPHALKLLRKRGLPHAHILLTLANQDKLLTPADVDNFISAELPNKDTDPQAFQIVSKTMIHGPCGEANPYSPCFVGGECSKKYPKNFNTETVIDINGFANYRRRNDGRNATVRRQEIDNRWVVPYNRALLLKYNSHINVELCARTKVIKYLFKYLHKGSDRATIVLEPNSTSAIQPTVNFRHDKDEVRQYLDCRYISALEACWRIFEFDLQAQRPSVERLQFHLPNEQTVIFSDRDDLPTVLSRPGISTTMFTAWMMANNEFHDARLLKYVEFPTAWVWKAEEKIWDRRKRGRRIGRLYYAYPSSGE